MPACLVRVRVRARAQVRARVRARARVRVRVRRVPRLEIVEDPEHRARRRLLGVEEALGLEVRGGEDGAGHDLVALVDERSRARPIGAVDERLEHLRRRVDLALPPGCHPSVKRYVRHARGWCADGVRTVRGGPEASCPVPPARTARRREECVARTYGTEAPGRYVSA